MIPTLPYLPGGSGNGNGNGIGIGIGIACGGSPCFFFLGFGFMEWTVVLCCVVAWRGAIIDRIVTVNFACGLGYMNGREARHDETRHANRMDGWMEVL